jgi:hypothetical protein
MESRFARWIALSAAAGAVALAQPAVAQDTCARKIVANVSAIDVPIMFNRLGAQNPNWVAYVLDRDLKQLNPPLLRDDKRLRPLVLRVPAGGCLTVKFTNRLTQNANPFPPGPALPRMNAAIRVNDQVEERRAGFHAQGLELVSSIHDDASNVGRNDPTGVASLAPPGQSRTYEYYAPKEGAYLVTNPAATFGGDASNGNGGSGMFAVVNVEPAGAEFFRNQVTEEELRLATVGRTPSGQPILDYRARYPATNPDGKPSIWAQEGKVRNGVALPILEMLDGDEIVHSDINAIITGPGGGAFPEATYPPLEGGTRNPSIPNRLEPFREFTTVFHDENSVGQAFPGFFLHPATLHTLHGVRDTFMINYGSGGIGSEIIANRLGVGPMHDCLNCAYEEFFLTSFTVGDPALLVDTPANFGLEAVGPGQAAALGATGPKATKALYPDDPSNVHFSYTGDFVKFRNVHSGKEHHVFHLHNHQWLFNPNDDNANYIDAQGIGPGAGYTYEISNGGSGNRNKSSGDAIYHCRFYPHFAQGMWHMWRIFDAFEEGTKLQVSVDGGGFHGTTYALQDGTPAPGARALPDGEIVAGTPIPAVVPLPGKPLAPMPGKVTVVPNPLTKTAGAGHPQAGQPVNVGSLAKVARPTTDANGNPVCDNGGPITDCTDGAAPNPTDPWGASLNPGKLKNPGYPFWIAGIEDVVGQRPPTPPMDMEPRAGGFHGGLPRHALKGYAAGGADAANVVSRLDFTKVIGKADAVFYPEGGTDVERVAMAYHATRLHPTSRQTSISGGSAPTDFRLNGAKPVPGAPFSDPCIDDEGTPLADGTYWKLRGEADGVTLGAGKFFDARGGTAFGGGAGKARLYQGANIQFDAVFNKVGYHYPQQRIIALWSDVLPTINKQRAPEPLVMRNNTYDCTMFQHSNLVPEAFELDDYQVRTPTDIIGQHIHLPKWDLTTADGAANGWNYEDGTLSPGTVRERIEALNCFNGDAAACHGLVAGQPGPGSAAIERALAEINAERATQDPPLPALTHLTPQPHPVLGTGPRSEWLGARVTLQRWFFDPLFNTMGQDRGLGIIFTHDHYGPSTHQQIGLYATVLVEPAGSTWRHNETGVPMYTRDDGGPTSWQAVIDSGPSSYREFYFEFSDFQHAYQPGVYVGRNQDGSLGPKPTASSFRDSINPSFRLPVNPAVEFPNVSHFPPVCPDGINTRPCPEAITADDSGMLVVNYRNEPVGLRVFNPNGRGPDGKAGTQTAGLAGDLAFALQSRTDRAIREMNVQPAAGTSIRGTIFPPPINAGGVGPGDPFTPMPRAYYGDTIRMKIQAGGQEHSHSASIHGMKWLQGGSGFGSAPNAGWRNAQHSGISEQFTLRTPVLPALKQNGTVDGTADYLYSLNPSQDGWWSGTWGVIRTYRSSVGNLYPLPNNAPGTAISNAADFVGVCPRSAPINATYDVTAVLANDLLGNAVAAAIIPADRSATGHVGGPLKANGGTLVYNPANVTVTGTNQLGQPVVRQGPLHDPTAILWVRTSDLVPVDPRCAGGATNAKCAVRLADKPCPTGTPAGTVCTAPVEPIVLRAKAGECLQVTLRNRLPITAPDLAGYNEYLRIVRRAANDRDANGGMTSFNANLVRPSSYVGLHTALVAYDVNDADGTVVGGNPAAAVVAPGGSKTVQFFAGDLDLVGGVLKHTAIELGGAPIGPADKLKQASKGMVGALVVEPSGATWDEAGELTFDHQQAAKPRTRFTRASASVSANGGTFRDFANVIVKGQNHRFKDGSPVVNLAAEGGTIPEDSEDSGQVSVNYGTEPLWFRFGLMPNSPFGNVAGGLGAVPNAGDAYSSFLTFAAAGGATEFGEPSTPVYEAAAGDQFRIRLLNPSGVGRASIMTLHGHVWQRTPYGCGVTPTDPRSVKLCGVGEVGSRDIGQAPNSFYMGAQDLVSPYAHFDVVLPSAGGTNRVAGDYLWRDVGSFGNLGGIWNLVRVSPPATP